LEEKISERARKDVHRVEVVFVINENFFPDQIIVCLDLNVSGLILKLWRQEAA
jgi:hypothetical protein